jgi:hypothetical protein
MSSMDSWATFTQRMEHWRAIREGRASSREEVRTMESGAVQKRDMMGRNRSIRMWRNLMYLIVRA